jgi:endonuclease/exonuclease/phosphatase (EEP) superfamily protein YafD
VLFVIALQRFPGERWWPTLLLVYSPQQIWVIPSLILAAFFLFRRKWTPAASAVAPIVLVLIMLIGLPELRSQANGRSDIRVLTWNLYYGRGGSSIPELAASTLPDVICLQEANPWAEKHLLKMLTLPQFENWHSKVCGELVILSRFPLKRLGTTNSALWVSMNIDENEVVIANVHLAAPFEVKLSNFLNPRELQSANISRTRQVEELLSHTMMNKPIIICGDFNTPPNSSIYRAITSELTDSFRQAGSGFGLSYKRTFPLV